MLLPRFARHRSRLRRRSHLRSHPFPTLGGVAFGLALVGVIASLAVRFPTLGVSPAHPRAGQAFQVDASVVSTNLRPPLRYEWDLDDDPTRADGFELDTGNRAVAKALFLTTSDRRVRVRITGADGRSEVVERLVRINRPIAR